MAASKDRVTFRLAPRYFKNHKTPNGMHRGTCASILNKAFKMSADECRHLMDANPEGFHITCRPSQFARFIVLRYEANECINGIKDLEPRLHEPTQPAGCYSDVYRRIGNDLCLPAYEVEEVLSMVGVSREMAERALMTPDHINVSARHGNWRGGKSADGENTFAGGC